MPDLHGCHTQAKNLDTLVKRVRDAIELCLEVEGSGIEPLAAGRTYREASRIP